MITSINIRLIALLSISFIMATVIGTLSHECGHFIAARMQGFDARIDYKSTWLLYDKKVMNHDQRMWFTLSGPLLTMLVGTIGFLLLSRSKRTTVKLSLRQWVFVFLSLFWLRPLTNFIIWSFEYLVNGNLWTNGDEIKLSRYFHLPYVSIPAIAAIAGAIVVTIVIFRFIPKPQRSTFILSGLTGGVSGYFLWFEYLGKILLP